MGDKVLFVDDDVDLLERVHYKLKDEGFQVITAIDGLEGIRAFYNNSPNLVIADAAMPRLNGFELCRRIRDLADTPIIMLTTQGDEEEIMQSLDLGVNDYLIKPFRMAELLTRLRATLRRARLNAEPADTARYQDDHLALDLQARQMTVAGEAIRLTPIEYKLLALLLKNKGRLVEFERLLEQVWGLEYVDEIDYLRLYIWHLRRKLEPDPKNPIYLINEPNTGYRFEPQA